MSVPAVVSGAVDLAKQYKSLEMSFLYCPQVNDMQFDLLLMKAYLIAEFNAARSSLNQYSMLFLPAHSMPCWSLYHTIGTEHLA